MTLYADRRFGTFKFGSGTLFGPSLFPPPDNRILGWGVEVDWDGDGNFTGANEAGRMKGFSCFRGRRSFLRSTGQGFETLQTGSLQIVMDNYDLRYDGWNSNSPLYPNVSYGKDIRIRVKDISTGTIYPVFFGVTSDLQPSGYNTEKTMTISAVDGMRYLRDYHAAVAIQASTNPSAAIGLVLDAVLWPVRWGRSLDASSDVINYWWANGNDTAGAECENLSGAFLGYFYIDASGQATYLGRSTVSPSVLDIYENDIEKDITIPQPFVYRRNVVRVRVHPRTTAASGAVYQLVGNAPSINPGAANAITIFGNYSYNNNPNPAVDLVTPAATTDYTANTQANGSGTDKTANITVTFTDLGQTGKFVITNNDASLVYLTKLQVRGKAVYEQNSAERTYPANPATVKNPRELVMDFNWQQDANVAGDFCTVLGPFMDTNHPYPIIKLRGRPAYQFTPDLFDVVTLDVPTLGVTGVAFRIGGIEHRSMSENCQDIETTFYLEPYISSASFWIWDTASVFDTSTIFGY